MMKMIRWVSLLMCCLGLTGAAAGLERINECGTQCSQGLRCRDKPDVLFPPPCQTPADGLAAAAAAVFHDTSLSTVMRCEGRQKCSLHLRVKTELRLTESIHGVSICTFTAGMISNCQIVSFSKASREKKSGMTVVVENDCTKVSASQHVKITVKTVPSLCGVTWEGSYQAPECSSEDLRRHVPECITGRLSYDVNPEEKELTVRVSDMLDGHNYHLRLCHKNFICLGTGTSALIKKEEPVKSAILPYSRPLPCLCIEGWSSVMDAPRVQTCPFKDRLEELWFGITFDPLEGTLSWEPACPVTAAVGLCQRREGDVCVDLPHASQNVSGKKIRFNKVDPHPQLCMKFTAGSQSWTRCPFADARFQAWELAVTTEQGQEDVKMSSQIAATFSVGLCEKSEGSTACSVTATQTIHVEKHKSVGLNLTGELCDLCLQVTRLDVNFAATVLHCLERCDRAEPVRSAHPSWDWTWVVLPAGVCLSGVIIVALVLHVLLTVYQRRKHRRNVDGTSAKLSDPAFQHMVPPLQTKPALLGGVLICDSPRRDSTETANLISR